MNSETSILIDARYIQDHFPGIGRYTYHLIEALSRIAPEETFTALYNPALPNTRYDIATLARRPNVLLKQVDVPTMSLSEQFRLPMRNARLFHSPYFVTPYFVRVPEVLTLFDLIPLRFPSDVPSRRARFLFRVAVSLAARTAARIIAPSEATHHDLVDLLHVPSAKISVVPLAAGARFSPQPKLEIERLRNKYSLPTRYVLHVGINKPHKNLQTLLRAWAQLDAPDVTLVIAGAWDKRYGIEQGAAEPAGEQEGSGRVKWIHDVWEGDLPRLYAGATAFVMPSLYEGFGLPVLEAMACGVPVVASNASSLPDVVGDAGLLFPPTDADALSSQLARLLQDAACRDDLRGKSLARAAQFSWDRTARDTLAVYERVRREAGDK